MRYVGRGTVQIGAVILHLLRKQYEINSYGIEREDGERQREEDRERERGKRDRERKRYKMIDR